MLYSNPTDKVKRLKSWLIFFFVAGIIFCVIGVILWSIVGGVVANPPYGSKCYQRGKYIHKANSFTYVYNSNNSIHCHDCIQTNNTSMYTTLNRCTTKFVLQSTWIDRLRRRYVSHKLQLKSHTINKGDGNHKDFRGRKELLG